MLQIRKYFLEQVRVNCSFEKIIMALIALISEGNVFHNLVAATWNDLSSRVFLFFTHADGGSNNSF